MQLLSSIQLIEAAGVIEDGTGEINLLVVFLVHYLNSEDISGNEVTGINLVSLSEYFYEFAIIFQTSFHDMSPEYLKNDQSLIQIRLNLNLVSLY